MKSGEAAHGSRNHAPSGTSQKKTLFKSRKDFENIWRRSVHDAAGVNCSGNHVQALTVHCHLPARRTRTGRIWNRSGRSCPVRSQSVMEPGEAAHRSRSESEHTPQHTGAGSPAWSRGTVGAGVAFEPYNIRGHHHVSVHAEIQP
jgi:hypothetical protein